MQGHQASGNVQPRLATVLSNIGGPLAVAVSGGVDSVTLATFAHRADGSRVEIFHAVSPAVPREATERVNRLAADHGWRLRIVDAREFTDANYLANPVDRCFFCKTNLYGCIARQSDAQILSGANLDDLREYRPGLEAAKHHSVRYPYLEAEIDKGGCARSLENSAWGLYPSCPRHPAFRVGSRPALRSARKSCRRSIRWSAASQGIFRLELFVAEYGRRGS
jgi:uncharacterized protein